MGTRCFAESYLHVPPHLIQLSGVTYFLVAGCGNVTAIKFLVEQKKRLRHDVSGYAIVLQNQLHMVEQQAAQLVAQRIAADPPRALMAVITPQTAGIGCWQRRQPNEEGGGAPCPSDFLLKREKRSAEPADGPSRHHPNAAANNDNTDATATVTVDKLDNDEKNEP